VFFQPVLQLVADARLSIRLITCAVVRLSLVASMFAS